MDSLIQASLVVLVFGGLIFFHELGHFGMARLFGMGVKTFSLGFGPVLLAWNKGKTRYQLALLPLGGFVSLVGEGAKDDIPAPFTATDSFSLRPAWQRFCVIAAGPIANLLLAWILCWGILWSQGIYTLTPVIGQITPDTPAAEAGLQAQDTILRLNEKAVQDWKDIPVFIQLNKDKPIQVTIERPGEGMRTLTVTPQLRELPAPDGTTVSQWIFGISPTTPQHERVSFFHAAKAGADRAFTMLVFTLDSLQGLITKKIDSSAMGGPIGIAQVIYQQAKHSIADVLMLGALISVNLGLLNLLPIPVLDGGHLFFLSIEMLTRRPVSAAIQQKAMGVGLMLLLALMLYATFNDIIRMAG